MPTTTTDEAEPTDRQLSEIVGSEHRDRNCDRDRDRDRWPDSGGYYGGPDSYYPPYLGPFPYPW
jgi:hypothetical protein